jgi:glycosyltransferase involved in cell wall biosynthesis
VRLFSRTGRKLKIAGDGPEYRGLKKIAASNIEFCGRVPDDQLRSLYAHTEAFVMPGEEDFGITMAESLASGKPVIALGRGGAVEVVTEGCGVLYAEPTEAALEQALRSFYTRADLMGPVELQARAQEFSEAAFDGRFRAVVSSRKPADVQEARAHDACAVS